MAHYKDLRPIDYFGAGIDNLLAIGWLERGQPFETGPCPKSAMEKIRSLAADPWQPSISCGIHECSLCQVAGQNVGVDNLFVPTEDHIYVAPVLIVHYIECHWYRPPDEFIDAVTQCPDTRSMDYKKLLLKAGGKRLLNQEGLTSQVMG